MKSFSWRNRAVAMLEKPHGWYGDLSNQDHWLALSELFPLYVLTIDMRENNGPET